MYVGCSINFAGTVVEEEIEGIRKVVEVVMERWEEEKRRRV